MGNEGEDGKKPEGTAAPVKGVETAPVATPGNPAVSSADAAFIAASVEAIEAVKTAEASPSEATAANARTKYEALKALLKEKFEKEDQEHAQKIFAGVTTPLKAMAQFGKEWAVGGAILVNAIGLIVAGFYYLRVGVPISSLPVSVIASAGISCVLMTGALLWVGYLGGRMARGKIGKHSLWLVPLFMMGILMLWIVSFQIGIYPFGEFALFALVTLVVGFGWARWLPGFLGKNLKFRTDFSGVYSFWWVSVILITFFADSAYPTLSRSWGGAAPYPVSVSCTGDCARIIGQQETWEVFTDASFVYIAMAEKQPPRDWWVPVMSVFPPTTTIVGFPRASVVVTRRWATPPPAGSVRSLLYALVRPKTSTQLTEPAPPDAGLHVVVVDSGLVLDDDGGVPQSADSGP